MLIPLMEGDLFSNAIFSEDGSKIVIVCLSSIKIVDTLSGDIIDVLSDGYRYVDILCFEDEESVLGITDSDRKWLSIRKMLKFTDEQLITLAQLYYAHNSSELNSEFFLSLIKNLLPH